MPDTHRDTLNRSLIGYTTTGLSVWRAYKAYKNAKKAYNHYKSGEYSEMTKELGYGSFNGITAGASALATYYFSSLNDMMQAIVIVNTNY